MTATIGPILISHWKDSRVASGPTKTVDEKGKFSLASRLLWIGITVDFVRHDFANPSRAVREGLVWRR